MTKLLNIRFTFACRTSHVNKEGKCPLILRVIFGGQRREIFTGLYCLSINWNTTEQTVERGESSAKTLNQNLSLILRKAIDAFDELKFSGIQFTIDELVDKIRGKEERPTLLIEFLEEGNQRMKKRVGTEILKVTYNKYKRSLQYMKDFLQSEYKVKNLSLKKLNGEFIEKYFHYLRTDKEIAHNTACKYLVCIKTILLPAIRSGAISDPYYGLRISSKPVFKEFLSQEELNRISELKLQDPDLDRNLENCLTRLLLTSKYLSIHKICIYES
ncbi:MAG: phage integrase SAM-like domain-containing protein [Chitinophagaceae bacterium]|nr:phage integrase SAM-like domain-containing protein [Chitinophagaceae bacterium]